MNSHACGILMGKDKGAWSDAFQSACEEPTSFAFQELDVKNCVLQQHDLINFPFAASSDDVSRGSKGCFLSVVLGWGVLRGFGSSHLVQRGCAGATAPLTGLSWGAGGFDRAHHHTPSCLQGCDEGVQNMDHLQTPFCCRNTGKREYL